MVVPENSWQTLHWGWWVVVLQLALLAGLSVWFMQLTVAEALLKRLSPTWLKEIYQTRRDLELVNKGLAHTHTPLDLLLDRVLGGKALHRLFRWVGAVLVRVNRFKR